MDFNIEECLHGHAVVLDMHDHPSLKTYLFNMNLGKRHWAGGSFNPFTMRVDLPKILEGGVNAILSTIYLPEKKLAEDCWLLALLSHILPKKFRLLVQGNPFEQTMRILDNLECAVARARVNGGRVAEMARSKADVCRIIKAGQVAIVHAVEGGHSLGGEIQNLDTLFSRGVCLITLGHFYENELVAPVMGFPDSMRTFGCFRQQKDLAKGLTPFGEIVVERMIDLGMIVDLTHSTPVARERVFEINNNRRPIVFSHVGVQAFANYQMNPSDDEIEKIANCGGVVGVIFSSFWLQRDAGENGLELIANTLNHIRDTGGIDSAAIGSDFDGFTDPPDDVKDMADMPKVRDHLLGSGFSQSEVDKILGGNAARVLNDGWGK